MKCKKIFELSTLTVLCFGSVISFTDNELELILHLKKSSSSEIIKDGLDAINLFCDHDNSNAVYLATQIPVQFLEGLDEALLLNNESRRQLFIDFNEPSSSMVSSGENASRILNTGIWMLMDNNETNFFLSQIKPPISSQIYLINDKSSSYDIMEISEIYYTTQEAFVKRVVETWNVSNGQIKLVKGSDNVWNRRQDLRKAHFKVNF